jgi:hypothetical protein
MSREENELIAQAQPPQGFAYRKDIVARGMAVLLKAEKQAYLFCRIGGARRRKALGRLQDIAGNNISRFVFELGLLTTYPAGE